MSVAISARSAGDRESLQRVLGILAQQDPTLTVNAESISGQTILGGMGELHLEIICARILREHAIEIDVGKPSVICLETLRKCAEAEGGYIRQTGGRGNYGHVRIRLEPNKPGAGFEFINDIKSGALPSEYVQHTEQGVREALQGGVLAGYEKLASFRSMPMPGNKRFPGIERIRRIADAPG